jgi:bifunctional non-homologous end joining protein LigD
VSVRATTGAVDPSFIPPMLASLAEAPLVADTMVYEPKYDGIRAIALIVPGKTPSVALWSRLGRDKTRQFPEVTEALRVFSRRLTRPVVLDGEIVAIDARGAPLGFQHLQSRINRERPEPFSSNTAYVAFDVLRDGNEDLRPRPLHQRRTRLEALLKKATGERFRLSDQAVGDGRALHERAVKLGHEGLVAKRRDSPYVSGKRSPDWRKMKLDRRTSAVVGGWTEPRGARTHFGALVLGQFDDQGGLVHVGQVGTGFGGTELARLSAQLTKLRSPTCPFVSRPVTDTRAHWVTPKLVVEVRYTEWTSDERLRHPTYLGVRDDVPAATVTRAAERGTARPAEPRSYATSPPERSRVPSRGLAGPRPSAAAALPPAAVTSLVESLTRMEAEAGAGSLSLPDGGALEVNNLRKVFWPEMRLTKGDLLRHYVRAAPYLLPVLADRPLVMKRYPNGILGRPFYQHRAPDPAPTGVRIEPVITADGTRPHLVGGTLRTLLYTAQLASISQDPWASRIGHDEDVDYVAFDLDPPEGLPFARVLEVARWIRDELQAIGATGFPKTSGAGGLHVYVRLPPRTPYQAGLFYAQIVATIVAGKHPKAATVERTVSARGSRVYVDYLQNIRGKTLASAYSVRANPWAGVSTPLTWEEVDRGVAPRDFTLATFAERLRAVGDLWAGLATSRPADLLAVSRPSGSRSRARTHRSQPAGARPAGGIRK